MTDNHDYEKQLFSPQIHSGENPKTSHVNELREYCPSK